MIVKSISTRRKGLREATPIREIRSETITTTASAKVICRSTDNLPTGFITGFFNKIRKKHTQKPIRNPKAPSVKLKTKRDNEQKR